MSADVSSTVRSEMTARKTEDSDKIMALDTYINSLPIGEVAEKVNDALSEHAAVVVTAPPGAGKSTLLPLTIHKALKEGQGKVILLEPRRVAARQIAERMAQMTRTAVGDLVGYRVRFESKVSDNTGIEVLTEGILTRMMVSDPTLDGISTIIFDEFHERGIITDTALALALETQRTIRPDLKIVVMSATIDTTSLCQALKAQLIESKGRMFDVDVTYGDEATVYNCAEVVAATVCKAWRETEGSILAFLPGEAEIAKCAEMLEGSFPYSTVVYPLYGRLSSKEQREAIAPPKKWRTEDSARHADSRDIHHHRRCHGGSGLRLLPQDDIRSAQRPRASGNGSHILGHGSPTHGQGGTRLRRTLLPPVEQSHGSKDARVQESGNNDGRPHVTRSRRGGLGRRRHREVALADPSPTEQCS